MLYIYYLYYCVYLLLWSVRGTLWGGYTACDAVSTMHEWGGEHTRRAWALFR